MFVPPLDAPRLDTVGTITYAMSNDRSEQLFVESLSTALVNFSSNGQHGLERLECLQRSFEANRAWKQLIPARGLGHDGSDKVVRQDMCPDFFPNKFRCFASKAVHLHD